MAVRRDRPRVAQPVYLESRNRALHERVSEADWIAHTTSHCGREDFNTSLCICRVPNLEKRYDTTRHNRRKVHTHLTKPTHPVNRSFLLHLYTASVYPHTSNVPNHKLTINHYKHPQQTHL